MRWLFWLILVFAFVFMVARASVWLALIWALRCDLVCVYVIDLCFVFGLG